MRKFGKGLEVFKIVNMPTPEVDISLLSTLGSSDPVRAPKYTFREVRQKSFLGNKQHFVVAQNRYEKEDTISIRIKTGLIGQLEWMNELQVYLLPNFNHSNILTHSGSNSINKRSPSQSIRLDKFIAEEDDATLDEFRPMRVEYWLINKYHNCVTLREFLENNTLIWSQMISIAKGIMKGLHYLHENKDYQEFDVSRATDGFIASTNGSLKKVTFVDQLSMLAMRPTLSLTIIHRNLTSMNIAIKGGLTPCIWGFEHAFIYHPFQPTNCPQYIESEIKNTYLTSQYSAPEILQASTHFTLTAMKSTDMYSCGILFWELLTRTILPNLEDASEREEKNRSNPGPYYEPFEEDLGVSPIERMLEYAVCTQHARPRLKDHWLAGKKTYRLCQTVMDLWDHDFDARIHTLTVIHRLNKLSLSDHDTRNKHRCRKSRIFVKPVRWPPEPPSSHAPINPYKCLPNIKFEEVDQFTGVDPAEPASNHGPARYVELPISVAGQPKLPSPRDRAHRMRKLMQRSAYAKGVLMTKLTSHKTTNLEDSIEMSVMPSRSPEHEYSEIKVEAEVPKQATVIESPGEAEASLSNIPIVRQTSSATSSIGPSSSGLNAD